MLKGGVAMYVNNYFQVLARNDLFSFKEQDFESLFLEIQTLSSDFRLVCGVIYRSPSGSIPKFCEQLEIAVEKINDDRDVMAYLCGDFNFDLTDNNDHTKYKQTMYQNKFFSCINRPTRFEKKKKKNIGEKCFTRTLIDHIWCNNVEHFSNSAILVNEFADHLAISCSLQTDQPHFAETCDFGSVELHFRKLSDAIKNSQCWGEVKHITNDDQRNQIQKIVKDVDKSFSELDNIEREARGSNQNKKKAAEIQSLKTEIKHHLTNLKDLRTKTAEYWLTIFAQILRKAADEVQAPRFFHSSYRHTEEHSQFSEKLHQRENELNRITNKLVRIAQKHATQVQATENEPLNIKDRVAIAESIGDSLCPIQLVKSRAFFLNKNLKKYLPWLDNFGKCYSKNFSLFTQHLIPLDVVEMLPDKEVKEKLFSLLHNIYIHSFKSVEQPFVEETNQDAKLRSNQDTNQNPDLQRASQNLNSASNPNKDQENHS